MATELHVATVRALLSGDLDEHLQLIGEVGRDGSVYSYGLLYEVVFGLAVRHRFGEQATRADVIRFVAQARANRLLEVPDFDILAAERLLLAVLGDHAASQEVTEDDSALIGPLLVELGRTLPTEEILADAWETTRRLEAAAAGPG